MKKKSADSNIEYKKFSDLKSGDKIYATKVAYHKCCSPSSFKKVAVYQFVEFRKEDSIFTSITANLDFPEDGLACRCEKLITLHNPAKLVTNDNFTFADEVFVTNRLESSVYYNGNSEKVFFATPDKRLLDKYLAWQYNLFINDFKQQLKKYRSYLSETKKYYKETIKKYKDE